MRQDTAPRGYVAIPFDGTRPTGGVYLSTMLVSRRLAASAGKPDWHIGFPPLRWAASGKGKEASGGRDIIIRRKNRGRGENAHACFQQEKWPTVRTAAQWRECWISATERFQ